MKVMKVGFPFHLSKYAVEEYIKTEETVVGSYVTSDLMSVKILINMME